MSFTAGIIILIVSKVLHLLSALVLEPIRVDNHIDESAIWEKNCMASRKLHEAKPSAI